MLANRYHTTRAGQSFLGFVPFKQSYGSIQGFGLFSPILLLFGPYQQAQFQKPNTSYVKVAPKQLMIQMSSCFFVSFFQLFSCHFLSHLCCSDASLGCVMYRVTSWWRLGGVTGAVRQNCPSNENGRKERVIFCLLAAHLGVVEELNPITALTELRYCCINCRLNAAFTLWKTRGWLPSRSGASVSHGINPRLDYATWWSAERSASAQTAGATTTEFFRFEVRKKKKSVSHLLKCRGQFLHYLRSI